MKYLVEYEADRVRFTRLQRKRWQMVSTRAGRLYRIDDKITLRDGNSADAMVIYRVDDQQPLTCKGIWIDPDETRAWIHSCKIAGTQKRIWGVIGGMNIEKTLTAVIVIGAIAWYGLNLLGI